MRPAFWGAALLLGCGDPGGPPTPAQLEIVSGDGVSGEVATTLGDSLTVRVLDGRGRGMAGVVVAWGVAAGGGSVSPTTDSTDARGEAKTRWTLGQTAGPQSVTASVDGVTPASFTATATPGPAAALTAVQGSSQSATVGTAPADSLAVRVTDRFGNGVSGVTVNWAVTGGGGSVSPPVSTSSVSGHARTRWTLGTTAGVNTARATSPGMIAVNFIGTGTAGPPSAIATIGGDNQTGTINEPMADSLVVKLTDQYDNPVPGVMVAWATEPGDGSVSPSAMLTRANGEAKTLWTLGPTLGAQRASATVAALSPVAFGANGVATTFNLMVGGMYLTQATQTLARSVPLVAGRAGVLRVWATANETRSASPKVRVRWYQGVTLVRTDTLPAPGSQVETSVIESPLATSWNMPVPATLIQPGLEIVVDVDPDEQVTEINETDNTLPATGRLALDVRTATPLNVTLVPVQQSANGLTGDVTPGNQEAYLATTRKIFPLATINANVHSTYVTSTPALQANDANNSWVTILSEINALRVAEGSSNHYFGVVRVTYTSGVAGIGYRPGRAALGWDYMPSADPIAAHELGHNFNRLHAPCGGPGGVDPNYPYAGGVIGVFGLDVAALVLKPPTLPDIMSYCSNQWISDYTYNGVMGYRASTGAISGAAVSSLLVWGRIAEDQLVLEPAFVVTTRPELPAEPGRYRLEGVDASGATVFSLSFQAAEVADLPGQRSFAFAVPAAMAGVDRLAMLRLSDGARSVEVRPTEPAAVVGQPEPTLSPAGPGTVRLEWNAVAHPMALVRDVATGQVLSFARGGAVVLPGRGRAVDVVFSDGLRGVNRRMTPR